MEPTSTSIVRRPRIAELDVIRGVALCAILLVNIEPVTQFGRELSEMGRTTLSDPSGWLQLLVQQRFFPIFSLLFGMGFSLFLESADRQVDHPRILLARRLLVLLPLGVVHQLLHPGEALAPYALVGLAILLPSSWLPRWAVAVGTAALLPAAAVLGGGYALIPALFLLGSVLTRYGVVEGIGAVGRSVPVILLVVFTAASVPALAWQLQDLNGLGFTTSSAVAGLLMAGVYVTGLLLAMGTWLRPLLIRIFEPFGKMALTNYVAATPLMVVAGKLLGLPTSRSWSTVIALALAILVMQWAFSTWWLGRYRQGPVEWLWRWATWGTRPSMRR